MPPEHPVALGSDPALVPLRLARRHADLDDGATVVLQLDAPWDASHPFPAVLDGAGFAAPAGDLDPRPGPGLVEVRRLPTLPDTVGPAMAVLVCGINPSVHAAASGVGYSGPGNRFWPAALDAGLVSRRLDPFHALVEHGIGMTDLAKRATPRAADVHPAELRRGLERVESLIGWLAPRVACVIGLGAWRTVADRRARAGLQRRELGGSPVFVMPSTSGLNARSSLADLTGMLREVGAVADAAWRSTRYGASGDRA